MSDVLEGVEGFAEFLFKTDCNGDEEWSNLHEREKEYWRLRARQSLEYVRDKLAEAWGDQHKAVREIEDALDPTPPPITQ